MHPQEAQDHLALIAPDLALACGFIPLGKRESVTAVYAFFAHLLSIAHHAREPMLGEIRLQWWRDVFEGKRSEGEIQAHPMAQHLLKIMVQHDLPLHGLTDMVEAVSDILYDDLPEDMDALEYHYGRIYSVLLRYASLILADGQECGPAGLAGPAGVAYGLSEYFLALPLAWQQRRVRIPSSLLTQAGVEHSTLHTLRDVDRLRSLFLPMLDMAELRLREFQRDAVSLPKGIRPAFAVMGLVGPRLQGFRKGIMASDFDPAKPAKTIGPISKTVRLWRAAVWGQF